MDALKVKNFIILVLLIVNAVLLAVVISDKLRGDELWDQSVQGAVELLEGNGISVSVDADLSMRSLSLRQVTRSAELEQAEVSAVLGDIDPSDRGGGIIFYGSTSGEATYRGTGIFDIVFYASSAPETQDEEKTAREYAEKLGLSLLEGENSYTVVKSDDSSTVLRFNCALDGARIINCTVEFRFMVGRLYSISGTRPLDVGTSATEASVIDVPTVLMRFLELTRDKGHVCSELRGLELCYSFSAAASGEGSLTPTWRIVTDTGEFYLNALTGREEALT